MRINTILFILSLHLAAGVAAAGDLREIELNDGSVITGEVVSLSGGVYSIKTGSLGTLSIDESKVRSIRSKNPGDASPGATVSNMELQGLQERMLRDEEIMSMIKSLQNDPDFQKILQDPETMRAVKAGDIPALMANPEFTKLLENSKVKDIQRKVGE